MLSTQLPKRDERGFTLIELLVVIIIIGILAAIAIPLFLDQRKLAVDASTKSDVRNFVSKVATAYATDGTITPATLTPTLTDTDGSEKVQIAADGASDYIVYGYNSDGKNLISTDKAFVFHSKTGQFTTEAAPAGSSGTGGSGSTGTSSPTLGTGDIGNGYAATMANASFNGGHAGNGNLLSNGGLNLAGGAFQSPQDGSAISGSLPILNGLDTTALYRSETPTNLHVYNASGSEVSGFSGCTATAYDLPGAYGSYFGYSGNGTAFSTIALVCSAGPNSTAALATALGGGKVVFTTAEGVNTVKITNTVALNGPQASTVVNTTVASTSYAFSDNSYNSSRQLFAAWLTQKDPSYTESRVNSTTSAHDQYAGDGSQASTSSIALFNNRDIKSALNTTLSNVHLFDKNGNDVTASMNVTGGTASTASSNFGLSYYTFDANVSVSFSTPLSAANEALLHGGKITFTGGSVNIG